MPDGDSPAVAACPLCRTAHIASAMEDHLRLAHRLYVYKSVHHSLDDTLEAILDDLLTPHPDDAAWLTLARLVRSEHGPDAERVLAERLSGGLARLGDDHRDAVTAALGGVIAPGNGRLVVALAESDSLIARRLALACLAQMPPPYDKHVRLALRDLTADPSLPGSARFHTLSFVLPALPERRAARILTRVLHGHGSSRGAEILRRLEARTGPLPVYGPLHARLDDGVRMSCPRCGASHSRRDMHGHLWEQHRLLLDDTGVRDPWSVIEEWASTGEASRDGEWLERCRVAVDKIDPQRGRQRLTRFLLARGQGDDAAKLALLAEARDKHAGCCPDCYAFVPVPREEPAAAVKLTSDRLVGGSYRVAISEQGLRPLVEVVTPATVVYRGQEPDRPFTPSGAAFVYASVFVLAALLCAMLWPKSLDTPLFPVCVLLLAAAAVHTVVRRGLQKRAPVGERVLGLTWRLLVPELHAGAYQPGDSAFAAGLARWYSARGRVDVPKDQLAELIRRAELAMPLGKVAVGHLAALVRLQIECAAAAGKDPVPLVVRQLGRCFEGKLPLTYAQHLLDNWSTGWWTRANLARLRVLVCDRAFEAGYEVQTLQDAGQNAPALGAVLEVQSPRALAALRFLWSQRAARPWDKLGDVATAFELAADAGRAEVFAERPDLLLHQIDRGVEIASEGRLQSAPARVQVSLAGVWLQEVVFSIPPRVFEVRRRLAGTELILGLTVFRSAGDLDALSRRVEKWFRWVFHEMLPQVDPVLTWKSPHRAALLRAWGAAPCPECGKAQLPRVGEVGIALEESVAGTSKARE